MVWMRGVIKRLASYELFIKKLRKEMKAAAATTARMKADM